MQEFYFQHWIKIFEQNAERTNTIYWNEKYRLTQSELKNIYSSISQFQRGESGEGKYIYAQAKKYVTNCDDDSYLYALKLFIYEEHRHAKYLAQFMDKYNIPKKKNHWVDAVFRWLRHHGNLEVAITVLLTAEIIAAVYYKALARATRSKCLCQLSERILEDEDLHIKFQSYALNRMQNKRNKFLNFYMRSNHKILLLGTILIVWHQHKKVFKAGGYNFLTFAGETLLVYAKANAIIKSSDRELLQQEQTF